MKKTLGTMIAAMLSFFIVTFVFADNAAAGENTKDGRFIAYNNGTVLDTKTNLMWAVKDNGSNINWQGAKSYCESYGGGGYKDWRMPTQAELWGLYDDSVKGNNGFNLTPLINLTDCCPWASEIFGSNASRFNFTNERWRITPQSSSIGRALPVRSGK